MNIRTRQPALVLVMIVLFPLLMSSDIDACVPGYRLKTATNNTCNSYFGCSYTQVRRYLVWWLSDDGECYNRVTTGDGPDGRGSYLYG